MSYKVKITRKDGTNLTTDVRVTPYASDENATLIFDIMMKMPKENWKKVQLSYSGEGKRRVIKTWPKNY